MNPTAKEGSIMLNPKLLDLYTDYLVSSFSLATATGLSELVNGQYSHDQITRFLAQAEYSPKAYWRCIKPLVRRIEDDNALLIVDDTIEEKPYTDENDIVCWHYDHSTGTNVKGINLINFLYQAHLKTGQDVSLPVAYEVVSKTERQVDPKTQKMKRKSPISKNARVRHRLNILRFHNQIRFKYVVFDSWFASKENLTFVRQTLQTQVVCALKGNRTVALSEQDKLAGKFVQVSALDISPQATCLVYLKGLDFPVVFTKQHFTNKDGSHGVLYLVSSDTALTYDQLTRLYQRRWHVEEFHKSLKQNAALEKSPTKTTTTQKNHIFASMLAFVKLELLKFKTAVNHFALKQQLYLKALSTCFKELRMLKNEYHLCNFNISA
jgi:hypothetical protein